MLHEAGLHVMPFSGRWDVPPEGAPGEGLGGQWNVPPAGGLGRLCVPSRAAAWLRPPKLRLKELCLLA